MPVQKKTATRERERVAPACYLYICVCMRQGCPLKMAAVKKKAPEKNFFFQAKNTKKNTKSLDSF